MRVIAALLTMFAFQAYASPAGVATEAPSALPTIDFTTTFPWIMWVSSEGHDNEYPAGFVYKILTVRNADWTNGELVLVRQLHDGSKVVAIHAKGTLKGFDGAGQSIADKFSAMFHITFQRFDFRDSHTFEEFREEAQKNGWSVSDISP